MNHRNWPSSAWPAKSAFAVLLCLIAAVIPSAAPGDLDPSFDGDGKVITGFSAADNFGTGTDIATAVAIQDDGKIVVGGQCRILFQQDEFCLARYNANGSLDTTFDTDGKVSTFMNVGSAGVAALAIQTDDKIVAAGTCGVNGDYCVARYNENGSLDTTFDSDGRALLIDFGAGDGGGTSISSDNAYAVAIQGDGKIVVAGQCDPGQVGTGSFCLARLNSNGSLDSSFGGESPDLAGTVVTKPLNNNGARAILVTGTGILAAGNCAAAFSVDQNCLVKYTSTGALDPTFGDDGIAIFYSGSYVTSAALHNGGVVLGGYCDVAAISDFCVARYTSTGSPDLGFGNTTSTTDNIAVTDMGGNWEEYGNAIAVASDQSIILAGNCTTLDFCVAIHSPSGTGSAIEVTTSVGSETDRANAIAIQTDGRIVVAGMCYTDAGHEDFCAVRYGDAPIEALVTTAVHDSAHNVITTATAGSIVHASVTVAPTADPAGTVTISWFANGLCEQPAEATSGALTLSSGAIDATAFAQTPATGGVYAFQAHYNGDGAYGEADGPCAPITVTEKLTPYLATTIHDSTHRSVVEVVVGTAVHPGVWMSGSGALPSGTVTLSWFTNGTCSGTAAATSGAAVLTDGAADVPGFAQTPTAAGTYAFRAQYGGDDTYQAATGTCEALVVVPKLTPAVTTQIHLHDSHRSPTGGVILLGQSVHDQVTVVGNGSLATGTVTVSWFTNATCKGRAAAISAPTTIDDEGRADVSSFVQTPTVKGGYAFRASYSGDSSYLAAAGPCEPLTVVAKLTPDIESEIHQFEHLAVTQIDVNDNELIHESVRLEPVNGVVPTGNVTVRFFQNGTCKGKATATSAPTLLIFDPQSGDAVLDLASFAQMPTAVGTYAFRAAYAGDASFAAGTGICKAITVTP